MEIFELRVTQIFSQVLYQTLQTTKVKFSDSEKPQLQSVSIFFNFCLSVPPFVFAYYSNLLLIFKAVILMFHSIWWLLLCLNFDKFRDTSSLMQQRHVTSFYIN